jgi:peptidoglycan/xylan/chitin deacetylase (PgdA/CDA1 family)
MAKKHSFVIHAELDWGGRVNSYEGIDEGIPRILDTFEDYGIKAIFFISTEILDHAPMIVSDISAKGHTIGSHGHFHYRFKEEWRAEQDRKISYAFLQSSKRLPYIPYCAPKFYYRPLCERYANPYNQVSILKYSWVPTPIPEDAIFYMHPFDICIPRSKAPNLLCKLLYSNPKKVCKTFEKLCGKYSH